MRGVVFGASHRFIKRDVDFLKSEFETLLNYNSIGLKKLNVKTFEEYITKMQDPEFLRSRYPGEVLELKVNPQECYVGDLEDIAKISELIIFRHWSEKEAVDLLAPNYWKKVITLADFLKWYRKSEWDDNQEGVKNPEQYRDRNPFDVFLFLSS